MLNVHVLTAEQMEAIDCRQAAQQTDWRAIPKGGRIEAFLDMELVVLPGVFPPKEDTVLLAKNVPIISGMKVLDIGTGTGALAVWAAQQGAASVVAVDVIEAAVNNAKRNVERLRVGDRVDVREGDVFSTVAPSESFDVILANLPGRNKPAVDEISVAQWDTGFRAHRALFKGARRHLRPGGAIYMVKANYPDLLEMAELAGSHDFETEIIGQSTPAEGDPRKYYALSLLGKPLRGPYNNG